MKLFASPSVSETAKPASAATATTPTPSEATPQPKDTLENEEEICKSFEDLHIAKWLVDSCNQLGIRKPTPVQAHCIPQLLSGRDVIGEAQTGSGKTAAFAVPILDILSRDPYGIFALVLTPTRELGSQIADQFRALGARMGVRVQLVTGGVGAVEQYTEIFTRPHVVIATPGRLSEILETEPRAKALFRNIKFVIYDEADRLLNPGDCFYRFLRTISEYLPEPGSGRCQYGLFTATAAPILRMIKKQNTFNQIDEEKQKQLKKEGGEKEEEEEEEEGKEKVCEKEHVFSGKKRFLILPQMKDVYIYSTAEGGVVDGTSLRKHEAVVVESCEQKYIYLPTSLKECYLVYILRSLPAAQKQTIVFTSSCKTTEYLHQMLETLSFRSVSLHSDLTQRDRTSSLASFRSGLAKILIATDVASRGLDIQDVGLVINYDIPNGTDDYVHRIGRTARAGRKGMALIFITPETVAHFKRIEKGIGKTLEEQPIPEDEVLDVLSETSKAREISDIYLDTVDFDKKHSEKKKANQNQRPKKKKRKVIKKTD